MRESDLRAPSKELFALAASGKRTSRYWLFTVLSLGLAGFLVFPVLAFFAGNALAGPYEGPYGILGFLINIYAGMSLGHWAAVTLLATPALIFVIWVVALRLRHFLAPGAARPGA